MIERLTEGRTAAADAISRPERRHVRLRPRYKAFGVEKEGLFLLSDRDDQILEGQIFVDLLPFLERGADEEAAADQLEDRYPRAFVHYAFEVLAARQLLTEAPRLETAGEEAFWDELGLDSQTVRARLAATSVGVTRLGGVNARPALQALKRFGMKARLIKEPTGESLHVVITDDYLAPRLEKIAAINRKGNRPWLLARGAGSELWIGPWFGTGPGCYECLSWRLRTNAALAEYLGRKLGDPRGITTAIARTGAHAGDRSCDS